MSTVEERKVRIPTCKIDKGTIREICELLEDEARKIKQANPDANVDIDFKVETKSKDIRAHTTDAFISSRWSRDLERVYLWYSVRHENLHQKVIVDLDFGIYMSPDFSVESEDPTWVNGITGRIEDIFNHTRNRNYLFRKAKYLVPIVVGFAFLLGLGTDVVVDVYYLHKFNDLYPNSDVLGMSMPYGLFLGFFFQWLFPNVEFEDYLIQTKIKKAILSIIGAIILGLIASGFSKLIFG